MFPFKSKEKSLLFLSEESDTFFRSTGRPKSKCASTFSSNFLS